MFIVSETFPDRSDAENAAAFFQDSQGGDGFHYTAELMAGTRHAAVKKALNEGVAA